MGGKQLPGRMFLAKYNDKDVTWRHENISPKT